MTKHRRCPWFGLPSAHFSPYHILLAANLAGGFTHLAKFTGNSIASTPLLGKIKPSLTVSKLTTRPEPSLKLIQPNKEQWLLYASYVAESTSVNGNARLAKC